VSKSSRSSLGYSDAGLPSPFDIVQAYAAGRARGTLWVEAVQHLCRSWTWVHDHAAGLCLKACQAVSDGFDPATLVLTHALWTALASAQLSQSDQTHVTLPKCAEFQSINRSVNASWMGQSKYLWVAKVHVLRRGHADRHPVDAAVDVRAGAHHQVGTWITTTCMLQASVLIQPKVIEGYRRSFKSEIRLNTTPKK